MLHTVNIYIKELKIAIGKVLSTCDNFKVVIWANKRPLESHIGCFNAPSTNEISLVIVRQQFEKRDIILEGRDNKLLQYPLLFCRGEEEVPSLRIYKNRK